MGLGRTYHAHKFILNRHTSVWHGTNFAFCPFFDYRHLGDGGTDRREILHDGTCVPDVSSSILEAVPYGIFKSEIAHPRMSVIVFC